MQEGQCGWTYNRAERGQEVKKSIWVIVATGITLNFILSEMGNHLVLYNEVNWHFYNIHPALRLDSRITSAE